MKKSGRFYDALMRENSSGNLTAQGEIWLNYALGTNDRGLQVVQTLNHFCDSYHGKRHLDIGCGYGGTCVALANAGTETVGVDIDTGLIRLARLNAEDHPGLNILFRETDVMDREILADLGKFDIITCDNVIEHVKSADVLLCHINELLNPGGIAYITIPNAFSVGQIRKDCHYSLLGISLLDPLDAAVYLHSVTPYTEYGVSFYLSYPEYEGLFRKYGFWYKLLNPFSTSEQDLIKLRQEALQNLEDHSLMSNQVPDPIKKKIGYFMQHHVENLESDLAHYKMMPDIVQQSNFANEVMRNYGCELWYVVLKKEVRKPRSLLRSLARLVIR